MPDEIRRFTLVCGIANQHCQPSGGKNLTSTLATASASLLPQAKNFTLRSNASCRMKSGASRWFAKSQTNTTGRAVRALAPHQITLQYTQTLAPPWALHMRQHPAQQGCACACAAPPGIPAAKILRSKHQLITERSCTAGRVLPRSPQGECTTVLDPSGDNCKARSGKARSLRVNKKNSRHRATRFCEVMCGDFAFCKERYEGVYDRTRPNE